MSVMGNQGVHIAANSLFNRTNKQFQGIFCFLSTINTCAQTLPLPTPLNYLNPSRISVHDRHNTSLIQQKQSACSGGTRRPRHDILLKYIVSSPRNSIQPMACQALQDPLGYVGISVNNPVVLGLPQQPIHQLRLRIAHYNCLVLACTNNCLVRFPKTPGAIKAAYVHRYSLGLYTVSSGGNPPSKFLI